MEDGSSIHWGAVAMIAVPVLLILLAILAGSANARRERRGEPPLFPIGGIDGDSGPGHSDDGGD